MTNVAKAVHDYVALRRALGFKMVEVSHCLADFVRFVRRERASHVMVDLDEMETLLQSNPGLKSRFDKTISFPDYDAA